MSFRGCLQCVLKLMNFVLAIAGVLLVAYSLWMLNDWQRHHEPAQPPASPSPPSPSPSPSLFPPDTPTPTPHHSPHPSPSHSPHPSPSQSPEPSPSPRPSHSPAPSSSPSLKPSPSAAPGPAPEPAFASDLVPAEPMLRSLISQSNLDGIKLPQLPSPWFIYGTMGMGILTALVAFKGLIGAETGSRICLSCYTFGLFLIISVQVVIVGGLYLDRHWEEDIPEDPTGQISKAEKFVKSNLEICQYVGLGLLGLEVAGLLFALVLRHLSGRRHHGYESEDDFVPSARQPLLPRQVAGETSQAAPVQPRTSRNDQWSARMRDKYGLDTTEFTYNPDGRTGQPSPSEEAEQAKGSRCAIM